MLVVGIFQFLFLKYLKKKHNVLPSILYSYMYLSIFIVIANIIAIFYHLLQPLAGQDALWFLGLAFAVITVILFGAGHYLIGDSIEEDDLKKYFTGFFIIFFVVAFPLTLFLWRYFLNF